MLETDALLRSRYQISYLADDQSECSIYHAYDRQDRQQVLIAALPHENDVALDHTRTLLQAAAAVQAADMLALRHQFTDGLTCYVVVDDPGGQDVERVLQSGPLALSTPTTPASTGQSEPAALSGLNMLSGLLDLLVALHGQQRPLLLGDLHSSDLWAEPDGRLYLAPFALVRPIGTGTPAYRAPELDDPTSTPTPASDLYAIGAMCYHLLTGWSPPTAAQRLAGTPLAAPRSLNAAISPLLERVVLRALHLKPADRYQTAYEMRQALELVALHPTDVREAAAAQPEAAAAPDRAAPGQDAAATSPVELAPADVSTTRTFAPAAQPATPRPARENTCLVAGLVALLVLALGVCVAAIYFLIAGPGRILLGALLWA